MFVAVRLNTEFAATSHAERLKPALSMTWQPAIFAALASVPAPVTPKHCVGNGMGKLTMIAPLALDV